MNSRQQAFRVGADVYVEEEGDDGIASVFVAWCVHHTLADASAGALLRGDLADRAVLHHGKACRAMRDAMAQVLGSAGFVVEHADDLNEYRPQELRITAGPERYVPSWADRFTHASPRA
ncbi:hypothetical protein [Streptomyces sp. CB03238]|uniref:hypothetical protein n=1 Tax=Streptomyces sp. CB03238 TaxID=1907777 RepID=UPI000A0F831F|nr:hypothetical protein [Streptomyces sp. CB03238]ORT57130.1 hypothetical protein BKD26_26385 [Streptomyces sp. CB03238]